MSTRKLAKFFDSPVHSMRRNQAIADHISNALTTSRGLNFLQTSPLLSDLNPDVTQAVLSNPLLPAHSCLQFFNFLSRNPSLCSSQKLNLRAHFTLIIRLFEARKFAVAKNIMNFMVADENLRCQVADLISMVEDCGADASKRAKFCDMLLRVYAENKRFSEAVEVFNRASELGFLVEERSCMFFLIQLKRSDKLDVAIEFFERMVVAGIEVTVYSLSLIVDCLCKKGEVERAMELTIKIVSGAEVKPNTYVYNSLIDGYFKKNDFERVNEVLGLMEKENVVWNATTYTLLFVGYANNGMIKEGEQLFDDMVERRVDGDVRLYTAMIDWCTRIKDMKRAFKLFDEMSEKGVSPNAHTYGALINGLCKVGQMDAAEILVNEMQNKGIDLNQVVFNTLIDGYCRIGKIDEALRLKDVMERIELVPDSYAYNSIATGLCRLNQLDEAKSIFYAMEDKGMALNTVNCTTLIDIHCKEGNFVEAKRVFESMEEKGGEESPTVVTYNALIDGYCKKGKMKEAHNLRDELRGRGLVPDEFTYTSLIQGECISGKVGEAMKLFNEMKAEKRLTPNVVAYTAMISGLAKEGRSDDAFRLYDEMKDAGIVPDNRVYASLVGSFHSDKSDESVT